MSARPDPRFDQKWANFAKALKALEVSVTSPVKEPRDLSGIIKDFEIVYELSWKLLKVYLEKQGHATGSAKNVFAVGFQVGDLSDENVWLEMIEDRNLTVHTYDEKLAKTLSEHIRSRYVPAFQLLAKKLRPL